MDRKSNEEREWNRPHFFQIMRGDFSRLLEIPPDFMKHISGNLPSIATIVGPTGGIWRVGLTKLTKLSRKGTYLISGWDKFVNDHSLKEYDVLIFRYDGFMQFTIQIFDESACEKEGIFVLKSASEKEDIFFPKFHQGESSSNGNGIYRNKQSNGDINHQRAGSLRCQHKPMPPPKMGLQIKEQAGSLHGQCKPTSVWKVGLQIKKEHDPVADEYDSHRILHVPATNPLIPKGRVSESLVKPVASTSNLPSFKKQMLPHNVRPSGYLALPWEFTHVYLPRDSLCIVIHDPQGRKCEINYICGKGRDYLSGGWPALARDNNLKVGDLCLFELVGRLEFKMHILSSSE